MDNKKFRLWDGITSAVVFVTAAFTYLSTIEPTASFWDCGEFIASSYKLEVGHPPGNPMFQLIARFFTMFADAAHAAIAVNVMSALCSALTIFLLYLTIVFFAKRLAGKPEENGGWSLSQAILICGSGAIGALAYCFSDTFWFSAVEGEVYAIEKKEDALALLAQNKKKFALDHMYIIPGTAPEALEELPVPTHAFIGGSSGNMKEIVELLIKKNPQVRIVINCITLETVGEALGCIRELAKQEGCECENEIVQLCVSRSKNIGRYHMMMGENPIYIITVQMLKTSEEVEEQA